MKQLKRLLFEILLASLGKWELHIQSGNSARKSLKGNLTAKIEAHRSYRTLSLTDEIKKIRNAVLGTGKYWKSNIPDMESR